MRVFTTCLIVGLAAAWALAVHAQDDRRLVREEVVKLQGAWKIVSEIRDGVPTPQQDLDTKPLLTFKGFDYTWGDGPVSGTIAKINPSTKPKTIDYKTSVGTDAAIYEIDGDTFKDCFRENGGDRPKEFASPAGSGITLIVYKRVR